MIQLFWILGLAIIYIFQWILYIGIHSWRNGRCHVLGWSHFSFGFFNQFWSLLLDAWHIQLLLDYCHFLFFCKDATGRITWRTSSRISCIRRLSPSSCRIQRFTSSYRAFVSSIRISSGMPRWVSDLHRRMSRRPFTPQRVNAIFPERLCILRRVNIISWWLLRIDFIYDFLFGLYLLFEVIHFWSKVVKFSLLLIVLCF